jgi:hypothetical protein
MAPVSCLRSSAAFLAPDALKIGLHGVHPPLVRVMFHPFIGNSNVTVTRKLPTRGAGRRFDCRECSGAMAA